MIGTDWYRLPAFTFAQAERALGNGFNIGPVHQRTVLRARLKHFVRLGLVHVGKSRTRARYSRAQIAQLALAVVLAQLGGMDPSLATNIIRNYWPAIAGTIESVTGPEVRNSREPYFLCLWSETTTGPWARRPPISLSVLRLQELNPLIPAPNQHLIQLINANRGGRWPCFFNLTDLFTRIEAALPSGS